MPHLTPCRIFCIGSGIGTRGSRRNATLTAVSIRCARRLKFLSVPLSLNPEPPPNLCGYAGMAANNKCLAAENKFARNTLAQKGLGTANLLIVVGLRFRRYPQH